MDGFVSLEVSPELAHDPQGTLSECQRLFAVLNRPNVMIKIPATLDAFLDHGQVTATLETDLSGAHQRLQRLAELGIDFRALTQKLQDDGVASFAKSYTSLLASIQSKRASLTQV